MSVRRKTVPAAFAIEPMEGRTLLSAVMSTNLIIEKAATSSADIEGYTPAQIRTAYGFDQITGDGTGQTIAIVDAYNDPKVAADLAVFDTQFDLPTASLKVVNQTGGTSLPSTDAGWAGEIALDVEWTHAIAPGAKILLVETTSDNTDDLMAGVKYARAAAGVSVVSLSWGGSESGGRAGGDGESTSQTAYDADFATPAGHTGVTFVAAAGDDGTASGAEWPATSPNVISVGGTSLTTSDDAGTYGSESAWSDTSGGYSTVEAEPTYQEAVQSRGQRSSPDVAYDADPNTGFAVYDSITDQGEVGWQEEGGTSAGAPQWAALVAIADQAREAAGSTTLGGASQTLPMLYSLYDAPDTSAYSSYTQYFNDVTTGSSGGRHGFTSASAGYDLLTGLGSPNAPAIVDALTGVAYAGRTTTGSGGNGTTTPTASNPFSTTFIGTTPATGLIGSTGAVTLQLTNTSGAIFKGPVTITVSLSTDGTYSADDAVAVTKSYKTFKLGNDASKKIVLKLSYGATLTAGSYTPIAETSAINTASASAEAIDGSSIALATPSVDLTPTFSTSTITAIAGKTTPITLTITNNGNSKAIGTIGLIVDSTTTGVPDDTAIALATIAKRQIQIAAGHSIKVHLTLAATDAVPGTYELLASLTASTKIADVDSADKTALAATT